MTGKKTGYRRGFAASSCITDMPVEESTEGEWEEVRAKIVQEVAQDRDVLTPKKM